jgi:hypothetical protein
VESGFRFVADLDSSLAPAAEPFGDGDVSMTLRPSGSSAARLRELLLAGVSGRAVITSSHPAAAT